jgi:hypothetical protein
MSLAGQTGSPCTRDGKVPQGAVLVPMEQWRAMGKPHNVEEFQDFLKRMERSGDRREHERFDVVVGIRLSHVDRPPSKDWSELTSTENLSRGGARVRSQLRARKGDVLMLEESRSQWKTRAQIQDVSGSEADRRLHLRFLDASYPDNLLPVFSR